ncbi:MAG: protein kinase domain-containing protein [Pseudonocardiales bacterium]
MTGYALPGLVHVRQVRADLVGKRVVARHRITRRFVSVTYLSQDFLADVEFRTRFAAQAGQLARVRDARVARLREFVVSGDQAVVVADHVDGTPLRALLIEEGAIVTEAAVVVLKEVLRGLAASHAMGVAHGDLKPENVLLTRSGRVLLVDFGLSTRGSRRLLAWSTPFYLAPEQWNGGPASPAGDVYAAAATFFECLAGAPPFHADSPAGLSALHWYSAPPLDAVPGPVRQLVERGLAKDMASRPSAREFLTQVDEVASHIFGPGWEHRGRRELTSLLTSSSHLPRAAVSASPSDPAERMQRPPIRLTAALGGALVMAAGLSSPQAGVLPDIGGSRGQENPPAGTFPASPSSDAGGSAGGQPGTESPISDPAPGPQSVAMAEPVGSTLASAAQPETMAAAASLSSSVPHQVASSLENVPTATQPESPAQAPSTPATGSAPAAEEPVTAQPMSAPPTHPETAPGSEHPAQCAEELEAGPEPWSETGFPWAQEPWNEESMELTPSIPEWSTGHEEHDGSPFGDMGW